MQAAVSPACDAWQFPRRYGWRAGLLAVLAMAVLGWTGHRVEVGRMVALTVSGIADGAGQTSADTGLAEVLAQLIPPQLAQRTEVARIAGFDPADLPPFSHIVTEQVREDVVNPATLTLEPRLVTRSWLVEPLGYLGHVAGKLVETLEIALWGTLVAAVIGLALALASARNVMPWAMPRLLARAVLALLRSVPELVLALFLMLAYGFGPIAGFMALGLHGGGVLGRFFAEQVEQADRRPQEALLAIGAGRLAVWRLAVLPEVAPLHVGSLLYVLDRNVRMATVVGLVGAGGIGQELKGRFDLLDYGHVGTILIAIFIIVLLLDQLSSRLRAQLR